MAVVRPQPLTAPLPTPLLSVGGAHSAHLPVSTSSELGSLPSSVLCLVPHSSPSPWTPVVKSVLIFEGPGSGLYPRR